MRFAKKINYKLWLLIFVLPNSYYKIRKHAKHIILRTSWVFGSHGNNFLETILRLITEKKSLNIVGDQKGSPASASMLANVTFKIVDTIYKDKNFSR